MTEESYNGTSFDPDSMNFFISENITPDIENVLRNLKIEGNTVKITEQLDRKTYEGVNKVLERLGGKWNRSAKVHIFPSDPTERINTVLTTGKLEPKIKTGYFPTPPEIARRMVNILDLKPGDKVLEPSAGQGGLLDQLPKGTQVVIGEILPENIQVLKAKGYTVNFDNFLGVEIEGITKVIMNPPFENQQDIEHVTHALRILQPGGTLVSIMSPGIKFRDNKKTTDFLTMLDADYNYEIIDLPPGSFKESGTGVNTVLLKVTKPMSTPSTSTVSSGFVPDITKISQELAARSHMGTSMDPEKRAQQELSTPPARRLSEFGIGERAQWYYIPQRR
jgi:predicted RNA methylase